MRRLLARLRARLARLFGDRPVQDKHPWHPVGSDMPNLDLTLVDHEGNQHRVWDAYCRYCGAGGGNPVHYPKCPNGDPAKEDKAWQIHGIAWHRGDWEHAHGPVGGTDN
jgi:hypothetical protein